MEGGVYLGPGWYVNGAQWHVGRVEDLVVVRLPGVRVEVLRPGPAAVVEGHCCVHLGVAGERGIGAETDTQMSPGCGRLCAPAGGAHLFSALRLSSAF